jgi:hypothetical protein
VEDLHRDFILSMIISLEFEILYFDILFDILTGQDDLGVYAGADSGHDHPVDNSERETHDENEEPISIEAASVDDGEDALDEPWDNEDDGGEVIV